MPLNEIIIIIIIITTIIIVVVVVVLVVTIIIIIIKAPTTVSRRHTHPRHVQAWLLLSSFRHPSLHSAIVMVGQVTSAVQNDNPIPEL